MSRRGTSVPKVLEVETVLCVVTVKQAPIIILRDGHTTGLIIVLLGEDGTLVGDGDGICVRCDEGNLTVLCDKGRHIYFRCGFLVAKVVQSTEDRKGVLVEGIR